MKKVLSVLLALILCLSLAVAVAADVLVPSVTAKPAPEVAGTGAENVVEVKDEEGNVLDFAEAIKLVVTPVADVMNEEETAISEEEAEALQAVYEELSAEGADLAAIVEGLEEALKDTDIDVKDLVVKDLFNVSLDDESMIEYLNEEGNTIDVRFEADIQEGQFAAVAVYKDVQWTMAKDVVVEEDGAIVATLEHLGTVAIFVA